MGGNFPYPVPQSSSIPGGTAVVTIQFARFGTILNFIPQILANDVIRLDVEPVVSNLDLRRRDDHRWKYVLFRGSPSGVRAPSSS